MKQIFAKSLAKLDSESYIEHCWEVENDVDTHAFLAEKKKFNNWAHICYMHTLELDR